MENALKLTPELHKFMTTAKKRVYSPHSLPSLWTKSTIEWSNNDEQFVIKFDQKTKTFTGHTYEWNERTEDWDDEHDVPLTGAEIEEKIRYHHLLLMK